MKHLSRSLLGLWLGWLLLLSAHADRITVPLDGPWQIEDSVAPTPPPASFGHTAPVPGLANLARPAFKDVDQFDSRELIANRIRQKQLPESARVRIAGTSRQERNYYWYRKEFRVPKPRAVATLKISKAQFGTAVWLNGQAVGEHAGCFTAGYFDLTDAIDWSGTNTLLIRIGAHPGVLPETYPTGTDFEKLRWTAGIYDTVSLVLCDNPVIESVQVAPRLEASSIVVQTRLRNRGPGGTVQLQETVRRWKGGRQVAISEPLCVHLAAGEGMVLTRTVPIPDAHLWTPEDPFLYVVESRTDGDVVKTRFGMREFRSDAATQRFYLNGQPYYLRGSNITLHRFFEDPLCGDLPWNDRWVRQLLGEIPKKMHWNSFRFCIGPAPDRWFEIADETGLLIQNEFFVWTGAPSWDTNYTRHYDVPEVTRQYGDWMRDHWNHPSVAIWDANNETLEPIFGEQVIPAVRGLDLSNRPWENSYNPPVGPDDPVEDHPYLFYSAAMTDQPGFKLADLETLDGTGGKNGTVATRPRILNEYGWTWLNRDGSPTLLTEKLYPKLLGPNSTAAQRFAMNAYLLAGKTEFWRAHRHYAGVLHFVYLTGSYPGVFTADHFADVRQLKLNPDFADYVSEAFKPLGVYLNFFQPTLKAKATRTFTVFLVNDQDRPVTGKLELRLETRQGKLLKSSACDFSLPALGDQRLELPLEVPGFLGDCMLKAVAQPIDGKSRREATVSRRWVKLEN